VRLVEGMCARLPVHRAVSRRLSRSPSRPRAAALELAGVCELGGYDVLTSSGGQLIEGRFRLRSATCRESLWQAPMAAR
jgi:hypothetical protein